MTPDETSPALRAGEVETRSVEGEGDRVGKLQTPRFRDDRGRIASPSRSELPPVELAE